MAKKKWRFERGRAFYAQLDVTFKEIGEQTIEDSGLRETIEFEILEATLEVDADIDHTISIKIPTALIEEFFETVLDLGEIGPDYQAREAHLESFRPDPETDGE